MPEIEVVKPFTLTVSHGNQRSFVPGKYEVEPEVAEHWYTKAHLKGEGAETPSTPVASFPHAGQTAHTLATGVVPERPVVQDAMVDALSSQPANAQLATAATSEEMLPSSGEGAKPVSLDPQAKPIDQQKPFSSDPAVKPKKSS